MSYSPGTKLSYADGMECATVVTNGNVIVTKGLCRSQLLKLDDWLILAASERVQEEYIPLTDTCSVCGDSFKEESSMECSRFTCLYRERNRNSPRPFQEPLKITLPKQRDSQRGLSSKHSLSSPEIMRLPEVDVNSP
jgi:hypothetical protein